MTPEMNMHEPDIERLAILFRSLGASDKGAAIMASQLLKRAEQLANERGVTRLEALDYLLKVTIAGKEGRVYEGDLPGNGTTMRAQRDKKG